MAEWDQDSKTWLDQTLEEYSKRRIVGPLASNDREVSPPECSDCGGSGKKRGCGGCGVTK